MRTTLILAIILTVVYPAAARGQSQITTATIEGRVFDESEPVLPRAHILVTHVDTGATRTVFTDESGLYVVPLLPVGEYELTTQLSGFTTVKRRGIQLTLGQTQEVDVTLKIASVDQSVEVSDSPRLIDVSRSETSRLVDKTQISSLPINGRRFLDLAFLTPGVYQERERNNLSLSGSRGINNNVNVDGADFNQPFFGGQRGGERSSQSYVISQEAIQEFQIVRAGFSAEFGRSTGGILNVITKSGSNTLH